MKKLAKLHVRSTRTGVFETNSSSTHSLVFENKNKNYLKKKLKKIKNREEKTKEIIVQTEVFGWSRESLVQSLEEKLAYLIADSLSYDEIFDKLEESGAIDINKILKQDDMVWIKEVEKELKIKITLANINGIWDNLGVDHDSKGLTYGLRTGNIQDLVSFLTDNEAYIEIDSDG